MSDENGGEAKEINGEDVQAVATASESKIEDKESSNNLTEVDETTQDQENTKGKSEELDQKNEKIEEIKKKEEEEIKENAEDTKEKENNKDGEIQIFDVTKIDKTAEDTINTAPDMAEKQEKDTSIKTEDKQEKKVDGDQRKSIFKDGQSKSDVQENKVKKIESKSYVKDGDNKTPQQNKPIIKDSQNRSAEAGSEHKEKKVQIVINADEKSASMKSVPASHGGHSSSDEVEDSDDAKCDGKMNGKKKMRDEEQDHTVCDSDVDSDKDCMLDMKDIDHACNRDENRSKGGALFGLSLSKLLRRRYIVILGILLGGCMLGIILYGVVHAAMDSEEIASSVNPYDGQYGSTVSYSDDSSQNSEDVESRILNNSAVSKAETTPTSAFESTVSSAETMAPTSIANSVSTLADDKIDSSTPPKLK